jgi:VIT1/CCC1 family predicted Fe2+/Mn2+ transporter
MCAVYQAEPEGRGQYFWSEPGPNVIDLRRFSFGGPAAIVTSMGLIVGLDAATVTKAAVIESLLIIALADNLTDSLSVHIYQESERLAERQAFRNTVANFFTRLFTSSTFVIILLFSRMPFAVYACVIWGFVLLSGLSYLLAKVRRVDPVSEIVKHSAIAVVVIGVSRAIGMWTTILEHI